VASEDALLRPAKIPETSLRLGGYYDQQRSQKLHFASEDMSFMFTGSVEPLFPAMAR
jgi:hypothetical protein